jgi:hypothetical protein
MAVWWLCERAYFRPSRTAPHTYRHAAPTPGRGGCTMPQHSHREVVKCPMHVFNPKTVDPDRCETCGISWDQHPARDPFPGGKTLTNAEMIANLKVTALQAIGEGEWILAATTCRLIAELEITHAVQQSARTAWNADTRTMSVPLLKVPMRDDKPVRNANPDDAFKADPSSITSRINFEKLRPDYDQPCTVCGGNVRMMTLRPVGEPDKLVPMAHSQPFHIDTFGNRIEHDHPPAIGLTLDE